jgi:hypothetical protein
MITSWADEETKANAKYDAIRGKSKQNPSGSNNNNRDQGAATTTTTHVLIAAIQRPAKDNSKKTSGSFKGLLKEKCPWNLEGNHTTEQCYQLRRALKDTPDPWPPHDKKGKKEVDEDNSNF